MNHTAIKEQIKELVGRYKISFIPLRFIQSKDNPSEKNGKIPAISGWDEYENKLPTDEDIDSWKILGSEISGLGIVTGTASNIGCIDVDTEDERIKEEIHNLIPANAAIIQGRPNRGGKYLFKLSDSINERPARPGKKVYKGIGEIYSGGGQIAIPHGVHTKRADGTTLNYEWKRGIDDDKYPIADDLPLLTEELHIHIQSIASGLSKEMIEKNLPKKLGKIGDNTGRWASTSKEVSRVVREGYSLNNAIDHLYKFDIDKNGRDNSFFAERRAGIFRLSKMNILKYYTDVLFKSALRTNNGPVEDMELPSNFINTETDDVFYDTWEKPDLPKEREEISTFNTNLIPEAWRGLIVDASKANNVPPEACFFVMLVQLSSLIGNKRWIQGKNKNKSWNEAHNIWSIYVSKSGSRKSQILTVMGKPMKEIQNNINDEHKKKSKELGMGKEVVEIQIKELKRRVEEEARSALDSGGGTNKYIIEIQEKIEKLKNSITVTPRRQLIVNSATPERFLEILSENPTGMMMVQNELQSVINSFKKKGYEKFKQDLMDSWDGNRQISMQTKTSGEVFIENACLSLYGAMQPSLFEEEMAQIAKGQQDDGFWQRSFIVFNDQLGSTDAIDIEFNYAKYHDAYSVLFKANDLEESDSPITMCQEAYELSMRFETRVNVMTQNEEIDAVGSFWSKFTGKVVKIASLLEFVSTNDKCHQVVSADSMRTAIYIMERQMHHIKNFFPSAMNTALKEIIYKIQAGLIEDGITLNSLENKKGLKSYFANAKGSMRILRELHTRGIMRAERKGKSTILRINPYLIN